VTFTAGEVDRNVALVDYLQQHRILVSLRYTSGVGGVRVACHLFNNREDIGRLIEVTGEFVRRQARATA